MGAYGMAATMQMQFQDPENDPIPTFMLTNELETLPLVWEPFWSTPIGLALAIGVPTLFFLIFRLYDVSSTGSRRVCGYHDFGYARSLVQRGIRHATVYRRL